MQLTYGYQVAPGCCFSCGRSTSHVPGEMTKVIDLCKDDPMQPGRWHVYLCELCIIAAYKLLNSTQVLIEAQTLADKEGEITALSNEITRLMDEANAMDVRLARAVASQANV